MKRPEKKNFHNLLKKLETPLACPAMTWKLEDDYHSDNGDGDFDEEILPVLIELNNKKWHTVSSCAGHSLKDIKNRHKGYLVDLPYRIVVYIHVSSAHIESFKLMAQELRAVTKKYFECSLGYQDDYSNLTEDGFVPFIVTMFAENKSNRDKYLVKFLEIAKKYNTRK